MGWSLEYVDQLSPVDLWQYESIIDAKGKFTRVKGAQMRAGKGRRGH